ncbi:hypothetical protein ADL26_15495, partial [Thermoactinomyces vulgaris]
MGPFLSGIRVRGALRTWFQTDGFVGRRGAGFRRLRPGSGRSRETTIRRTTRRLLQAASGDARGRSETEAADVAAVVSVVPVVAGQGVPVGLLGGLLLGRARLGLAPQLDARGLDLLAGLGLGGAAAELVDEGLAHVGGPLH